MDDWSSHGRIVERSDADESIIAAMRIAIIHYLAISSREAKFGLKDQTNSRSGGTSSSSRYCGRPFMSWIVVDRASMPKL